MLEVFLANAFTVLSFNPRFKIVSIIPGIETLAPDLTETKSGLFKSPNFFPHSFSTCFNSRLIDLISFEFNFLLFL